MSSVKPTIGIFTTDKHLVIRSWDSWLAEASGIPVETARGQALPALFPELESRGLLARFERVLTEGIVEVLAPAFHHYFFPCAPAEPSLRYDKMQQHVTIAPLVENETILGTIVTIEDVTKRLDREHELAQKLASANEQERWQAAQSLAEEETVSAAERLAESLGDESWRVRKTAVDGLARKAGDDTISILLRALREEHRNPGILNSALQVLALSGIDALEPLAEFLQDADTDLRIYATHALGDQHDARAIPILIGALQDENVNVRYHAIEALGKLRAVEAVEALAAIAESGDFFLAFPALDTLTLIGESRIAPRLVALLKDEILCSPATDALGRLGDEEVVAPLVALLNAPKAPAVIIAQALATLFDRYEKSYQEGSYIADLVRQAISPSGVQNLLAAIERTGGEALRALALTLGWLEGEEVEGALVQLLGQASARKEVVEALVRYGERVTQLLIDQLQAEEIETHKAAIVALGRIGDPKAVPALVEALTEDKELVIVAADALGKIGDRRAFEALLGLIGHKDAAVRQAAIAAINSLGHPDMAAHACRLLEDPNPLIRESAVKIAGYFGYRECTDLLLARCRDAAESVRRAALEHLPYLDDERVVATLADALKTGSAQARAAAASAFSQVESEVALPYLHEALGDQDPWVRYFATRSLGRHGNRQSLVALTELAQADEAGPVRIAAIVSLGKLNEPQAVAALASLIETPDSDIRRAALQALGKIQHPEALPPLLGALRSPDREQRLEAVQALGTRSEPDVVSNLQWTSLADQDTEVVRSAITALARLASPTAIAALVELTVEARCREASIEQLSQFGEPQIDLIGEGLKHTQAGVRRAVIEVLGRMKHPQASEWLSRGLDDEESTVRLAAANALARLGTRSADRKLLAIMRTDPDTMVRRAAQRALRK
jgi:HEAT repeat protein